VRVAAQVVVLEPDALDQFPRALDPLAVGAAKALHAHGLGHDAADRHPRVQGRVRVLKDHLHPAAVGEELVALELGDVRALEQYLAGGRLIEPNDRAPGGRLAAAGLADERERLPALDREIDAVDRLQRAPPAEKQLPADREVHPEAPDLDQGAHGRTPFGAFACIRWQLTRCVSESTVSGASNRSHTGIRWRQRGANGQPGGG